MIKVYLQRYVMRGDGVFGEFIGPKFKCFSVERPWLENVQGLSCVPAGTYPIVLEYSPKFAKPLWELKNVPNRSEAKIHPANRSTDLEGCIGLGEMIGQDAKGWFVVKSQETIKAFQAAMGTARVAEIIITDVRGPDTRLKPLKPLVDDS